MDTTLIMSDPAVMMGKPVVAGTARKVARLASPATDRRMDVTTSGGCP